MDQQVKDELLKIINKKFMIQRLFLVVFSCILSLLLIMNIVLIRQTQKEIISSITKTIQSQVEINENRYNLTKKNMRKLNNIESELKALRETE